MTRARDVANVLSTATSLATDTETAAAISSHNTAGNGHFARGTTENRPGSPAVGDLYFDTTLDGLVQYTNSQGWKLIGSVGGIEIEYLVIAGGGGGGRGSGAGGGAGGYRSSVFGEFSGGGSSAESKILLTRGVSYSVVVGAGGPGQEAGSLTQNGSNSSFDSIVSIGGGGGGGYNGNGSPSGTFNGKNGGSGGGSFSNFTIGVGTAAQGFNGGIGATGPGYGESHGGGGGAGAVGANGSGGTGGNGGNGVLSAITGSSTYRAGGGGGGAGSYYTPAASSGGLGGGGAGAIKTSINGGNGTDNTGGGGGGGSYSGTLTTIGTAGNGGSGIVIIRAQQQAESTSGSPNYTTFSTYHVYEFTSSGSITF